MDGDKALPWYLFSSTNFETDNKDGANSTEMRVLQTTGNGQALPGRSIKQRLMLTVEGREIEETASLKKLLGFTFSLVFFMALCALVFSVLERSTEERAMSHWRGVAAAVKTEFNLSDRELLGLISRLEGVKKHGLSTRSRWTFYNAFWFTMTITTTIGFGHITPATSGGRLFCIICGLIGIPLNALVLKHVGNKIRLWVTRGIQVLETKCLGRRTCQNAGIKCACVLFVLMIIVIILGGCLDLIFDGWTFTDGIYFNFVALSTIGFGDIYPSVSKPSKLDTLGLEDTEKMLIASGIMVVYLTLGLAVVSSVVVSILTAMEDCNKAKRRLVSWRKRTSKRETVTGTEENNGTLKCGENLDVRNDMEERYSKKFGF